MRPFIGVDITKEFYDYPVTSMIGLTTVNVELTSMCNKSCEMCGRRRLEKEHSELCDWNHMNLDLMYKILLQIPSGIVVQFHNNGEPLLYPYLYQALNFRDDYIRCFNTNGKLLLKKANYIIDNMETLTVSVVENDSEADEQYEIVKKFLEIKDDRKPYVIFRLLGNIKKREKEDNIVLSDGIKIHPPCLWQEKRWHDLAKQHNCLIATRILHSPYGSYDYTRNTTKPEIGICLDLLNHLVVDRYGDVYPCVRYNSSKYNKLGNIKETNLVDLWNGATRKNLIKEHIKGNRNCSELCSKCHFYGVPTS